MTRHFCMYIIFLYLSVGKRGFPLKNHSYSGSGYPATKAVNLAAMPLNTISSPIFLRNSGASDLPFSMNSTISNCPLEDPDPSLLLATHSKIPRKIKYVLESTKIICKLNNMYKKLFVYINILDLVFTLIKVRKACTIWPQRL